jgi:hypothetical protein
VHQLGLALRNGWQAAYSIHKPQFAIDLAPYQMSIFMTLKGVMKSNFTILPILDLASLRV